MRFVFDRRSGRFKHFLRTSCESLCCSLSHKPRPTVSRLRQHTQRSDRLSTERSLEERASRATASAPVPLGVAAGATTSSGLLLRTTLDTITNKRSQSVTLTTRVTSVTRVPGVLVARGAVLVKRPRVGPQAAISTTRLVDAHPHPGSEAKVRTWSDELTGDPFTSGECVVATAARFCLHEATQGVITYAISPLQVARSSTALRGTALAGSCYAELETTGPAAVTPLRAEVATNLASPS